MTEHEAFLRAIAANPDDDAPRLIFSDWLEENGELERADFIRTQCQLASARLAKKRRQALRLRERELLDAHRRQWCQAVGLPIEDVSFERGLIARARLSAWEAGCPLDPQSAPQLGTLTELDLSELQLGDDGLAAFAQTAQLPALRKLILSDNGITDVGAAALASAAGLPRLDTLYLFGNPISDRAHTVLEQSPHFRLMCLDVGLRAWAQKLAAGAPGEILQEANIPQSQEGGIHIDVQGPWIGRPVFL
jgi:uncharacterized protein (TIGR02996 family)